MILLQRSANSPGFFRKAGRKNLPALCSPALTRGKRSAILKANFEERGKKRAMKHVSFVGSYFTSFYFYYAR